MKTCTRCKISKDEGLFYKRKSASDGLQSHCKECRNAVIKIARKNKIAKYREEQVLVSEKICFTCKETKSANEYNKSCEYVDGLHRNCKTCEIAYKSKWHEANHEEMRESDRRYREENRPKVRSAQKTYRLANKERYAAYAAKRRAAKLQRLPKWADLKAIQEFYENCPPGLTVDHIIPLQGEFITGLHIESNLKYLTIEENSKKNNRIDLEAFNQQFQQKLKTIGPT